MFALSSPSQLCRVPHTFAFFANVWASAQTPFYDFNVWTDKKRVQKLRYMHRNPVKRGLAPTPPRNEEWRWSSYPFYLLDEPGPVRVNEGWGKISFRDVRRERQI